GSKVFSGADLAAITFSPDVDKYRPVGDAAVASANYNLAVTDKYFKFPQVWRTNVAIDHDFGNLLIASLDFAYTKDINAVYHQNVNLPNATEFATGPDNRPIFYKTFPNTGTAGAKGAQINTNVSDA